MKRAIITLGSAAALLLAAGCTGEQPAEQAYEKLEESVEIENNIQAKQPPLVEAEEMELALYDEMLELSSVEEIEPLAEEAVESAEYRLEIMEEEKQLIEESFNTFQESEEYLNEVDEEEAAQAADHLINIMHERYELYRELYNEYTASVQEDITLYEMMKNEATEEEELQEQHEKVNEYYNRITELNQQFNELTAEYNEAKLSFYQASDLNVSAE